MFFSFISRKEVHVLTVLIIEQKQLLPSNQCFFNNIPNELNSRNSATDTHATVMVKIGSL